MVYDCFNHIIQSCSHLHPEFLGVSTLLDWPALVHRHLTSLRIKRCLPARDVPIAWWKIRAYELRRWCIKHEQLLISCHNTCHCRCTTSIRLWKKRYGHGLEGRGPSHAMADIVGEGSVALSNTLVGGNCVQKNGNKWQPWSQSSTIENTHPKP